MTSWGLLFALIGCGSRTSLNGVDEQSVEEHPATPGPIAGTSQGGQSNASTTTPFLLGGRPNSSSSASGARAATTPQLSGGRAATLASVVGGRTATNPSTAGGRTATNPSTMGGRVATTLAATVGGRGVTNPSTLGGRVATSLGGQPSGGSHQTLPVESGGQRPTRPPLTSGGYSTGGQPVSRTRWTGGNTFVTASTTDGQGGTPTSSTTAVGPCPAPKYVDTGCRDEVLEGAFDLCNDLDDDCDGVVDEGCPCTPGAVKSCFAGPPLRRNVGACRDGTQSCQSTPDLLGQWGPCLSGMTPQTEVCDNLDNDCNGCRDEVAGCEPVGSCPGPDDPRIVELRPFDSHALNAADFYFGDARSYTWTVEGGPCDRVAPGAPTGYQLSNASSEVATLMPRLSGDYTVTLAVQTLSGAQFRCDWVVPVRGPGLRIEMCYPESDRLDLDLYLKRLSTQTPWFEGSGIYYPNPDTCAWHNCEAEIRGSSLDPSHPEAARANWGYANSPIGECQNGPRGVDWVNLGYCANPRLDIDNNLVEEVGKPENINIDQPRDGDAFRIMVQNFSGYLATPIVNVYCSGIRVATFGEPPDAVRNFYSYNYNPDTSVGAMWRVADVTTHVGASGTVSCDVTALHPEGDPSGYVVTVDDPSF